MGTVPCLVGHLAESLPFTLLDTSGASLPIRDNQKHLQTLLECPWGGGGTDPTLVQPLPVFLPPQQEASPVGLLAQTVVATYS